MTITPLRIVAALTAAGAGAWFARLLAHAKVPPPEGRWREIDEETLG